MDINGEDHVLGRLATHVVGELKDGEGVTVHNADRVIVKGNPDDIVEKYRNKYESGSKEHGPKYPKAPDRIVRRTVEGMLPDTAEGEEMRKRLKVRRSPPKDGADEVDEAKVHGLQGSNFMRMKDISDNLGR
jgi:large subunit ribosomal protein L13